MKLAVLQEHLDRGLDLVLRAVASKTTLPVLNNILLETEDGRLKLGGTNLEMGITTYVECQIEEEGAITIPARLLTDFIGSLPNASIEMLADERSHNLSLKCDRFEANIKGLAADEFPVIPQVGNLPVIATIKVSDLRAAISQLVFVAATDDTRPVLTGIQIEFDPQGQLHLVAADGFRLATLSVEADCQGSECTSIIVPGRAMAELGRILPSGDETVEIYITANKSQAIFHSEKVDMVTRLIDGPYPNISQIIPQKYDSRMVVDTAIFLKAMKIANYFAKASNSIVKLKMEPDKGAFGAALLTISANAAEVGDNKCTLDVACEGPGGQIAFNAEYIIDVLAAIDTPQVAVEMQSHTNPGVFKPVGSGDYTHVIMPMHLPK